MITIMADQDFVSFTIQVQQHEFRENFRKTAPFAYNSEDVYRRINQVNSDSAMMNLYAKATLFKCMYGCLS